MPFFWLLFFGNAKKSNKQSGYSALTINKKRYKIATTQRKIINNKNLPKNHRTFHLLLSRFHRRSDLPFLGKFVVFELAAQASFKFSVKEMVTKRREQVKSGCLTFGHFSLAKQRKVTNK
ncbi:MAG: hypothetical protein MSQ14_00915 [[Pasteurella] aerogenes]|nr:hypothetical protein [[Pasteurella] aerogenes]